MPPARFAGQQIESWNPAIDVRSVEAGRLFVLQGKNYLFDSKGPKSGFGHRLVGGGRLGNLGDIQSADIDRQTIVFASNGIYRQEYALPAEADALEPTTFWRKLRTFDESQQMFRFGSNRWTGDYLNGATYVGNVTHGLYIINRTSADLHTADGVPSEPLAVFVSAGRLVVVNPSIFGWSAPGDGSDFIPRGAGAGFQKLIQYMSGDPIAVTHSDKNIVIWTRNSAMLAEYIGGVNVFRFDTFESQLFPLGPMAVAQDVANRSFMMTRHGLMILSNAIQMEEATPTFNQMFRAYLNDNPNVEVRLEYLLENDQLFVQVADSANMYQQTFVLSVAIDKWGSFDEEHLGICRFGEQQGFTGFADTEGYMHKFNDTPDKEVRGIGLVGLDSFIDVGYLNTPDMLPTADTILEMQELMISARMSFPPDADLTIVDRQGLGDWWNVITGEFVNEDYDIVSGNESYNEDWDVDDTDSEVIDDDDNDDGEDEVIDDDDNNEGEELLLMGEDWDEPGESEDWNLGYADVYGEDFDLLTVDDSEDYDQPPMTSVIVPDPLSYEDWNLPLGDEDWNGPYSFLNFITYDIKILSSMNGYEYDIDVVPELGIERMNRDLWVMLTSGRFQTVRLAANVRWQKYHLTALDATINYYGQHS